MPRAAFTRLASRVASRLRWAAGERNCAIISPFLVQAEWLATNFENAGTTSHMGHHGKDETTALFTRPRAKTTDLLKAGRRLTS